MPRTSIYLDDTACQQLAIARKKFGLTQVALAAKCQCSAEMVKRVESGKKQPSSDMLDNICEALDLEWHEQSAIIFPRPKRTKKKKTTPKGE